MLKNMWYATEFSKDITNKPKAVTLLGQKLVMWRDSKGAVHTLSDLCVHRGGPLSRGWLDKTGDQVVCPYHGWEFEGSGACTKIPAHPQRSIPKKARVDSYPVQEKYGFVFVFMGDLPEDERPPLPEIPELDDPQYKKIYGEYNWDVNYERATENAMDPSHAAFVHGNRFGDPDNPQIPDFQVVLTPWSATARIPLYPPPGNSKGIWGALFRRSLKQKDVGPKPMVEVNNGFFLPNIVLLYVPLPFGTMILVDANVPVGPNKTRSLYIAMRDFFKGDWADRDAHKRVQYIFKQDDYVISEQRPELLPYDLSEELHVRSDALQVAYRRRRNELIDAGWGIDMDEIQGAGPSDTAVIIPSPARREVPELARAWTRKLASQVTRSGERKGDAGGASEYELRGEGTAERRIDYQPKAFETADVDPAVGPGPASNGKTVPTGVSTSSTDGGSSTGDSTGSTSDEETSA